MRTAVPMLRKSERFTSSVLSGLTTTRPTMWCVVSPMAATVDSHGASFISRGRVCAGKNGFSVSGSKYNSVGSGGVTGNCGLSEMTSPSRGMSWGMALSVKGV